MQNKQSVKSIYSKNYLIFVLIGFLPLIWKILQIVFLIPFENAMNILGQMSLIAIIFKMFQETLINPLFKIFGDGHKYKSYLARKYFLFITIATTIFTIIIFLLIPQIMVISKTPSEIYSQTLPFLKLCAVSFGLNIIMQFLYTFNLVSEDNKQLLIYFLVNSIVMLLLNFVLSSQICFGLGVNGIAISNIIVNLSLILYLFITLPKSEDQTFKVDKNKYFRLGFTSFLETTIRNVVYYFIILVFLNIINNQDLYYVANDFIWSIMLVPVLAQSSLIKQTLSNDPQAPLKHYFVNTIYLCIFMAITLPLAFVIFKHIYAFSNYMEHMLTLLKLFPCYIIFCFDSVIEAYFISIGQLKHILIQTILTNIVVYGTAYILYLFNVWSITLDAIILLFNLGVIISSMYTITAFIITKQKNKQETNNKINFEDKKASDR